MDSTKKIGKYLVIKSIGSGGFGKVYQCYDKINNKYVAIKKIPEGIDEKLLEREKDIANHPGLKTNNLVQYMGVFVEDKHVCIVMELYPLGDLQTLVNLFSRTKEPVPESLVCVVGSQIVNALCVLQEFGIAHRDVKPPNIFIDNQGNIRLGDFGLVKVLEEKKKGEGEEDEDEIQKRSATNTLNGGGSPGYVAPEIMMGERITFLCDVFSLGCCLYALIMGSPPYDDTNMFKYSVAIAGGKYITIPTQKKISQGLCTLIQDMCQIDPEKRPSVDSLRKNPFFLSSSFSLPSSFHPTSLSALDDVITILKEKIKKSETENTALVKKLEEKENEISSLKEKEKENKKIKEENEALQKKLEDKEKEVSILKEEKTSLTEQLKKNNIPSSSSWVSSSSPMKLAPIPQTTTDVDFRFFPPPVDWINLVSPKKARWNGGLGGTVLVEPVISKTLGKGERECNVWKCSFKLLGKSERYVASTGIVQSPWEIQKEEKDVGLCGNKGDGSFCYTSDGWYCYDGKKFYGGSSWRIGEVLDLEVDMKMKTLFVFVKEKKQKFYFKNIPSCVQFATDVTDKGGEVELISLKYLKEEEKAKIEKKDKIIEWKI